MNTQRNILNTLAITAVTLFASGSALAHSNHDHSTASFNWEFSKKLNDKIERSLNADKPTGFIGMNPFEQRKFKHYGIKVGNKFNSTVRNVEVTFERTSAGLKITDASIIKFSSAKDIVPIKNVSIVSKVSLKKPSHIGHDHSRLPVEWVFGNATNTKIVKHMFEGKDNLLVGLTHLEQKLLNAYEIKVGNKFHLSISGHGFVVKRTSTGINILSHVENGELAKADSLQANDNI
ncbi:MAG: hypothetical protein HOB18_12870 [Nitrospina sp.]|nr:hypothetical protein [Nitrospina sp.]